MEAAKGTNLFFAIYANENGKRNYETIPLNTVIERLKQGLGAVPEINEKGDKLLFYLSPNDIVYVPVNEDDRLIISSDLSKEKCENLYKMVSSSGTQCFFIKSEVATSIVNKMEYSPLNKMEKSIDGIMIKEVCWKVEVDRLGKITKYSND
ncbi:CRISPR-associated endonuclease Cas9 [bioreactor metagenome]|uniref:CRISPR-associated endonuclease Cas9 n=1 Tax=bioreactor metagenome TaxID=1076179 RepID=A0A645GHY1_9ZZZZ